MSCGSEMEAMHTCEICDVAQQPDEQEAHRQGIGAFGLVVGDKLRKLREFMSVMLSEEVM